MTLLDEAYLPVFKVCLATGQHVKVMIMIMMPMIIGLIMIMVVVVAMVVMVHNNPLKYKETARGLYMAATTFFNPISPYVNIFLHQLHINLVCSIHLTYSWTNTYRFIPLTLI